MTDMAWIVETSRELRLIFESSFYAFAGMLLMIGILMEFFKFPIGGVPSFAPLVGRVIVAFLLLVSYQDVANAISELSDALSAEISNTNDMLGGVETAWSKIRDLDWGWVSIGQTLIWFFGYISYVILYISVFFFDAAIVFVWMLCFVMSPLLIALFILPQTAMATKALYRTLLEVAAWKVVWSLTSALLWKSTLTQLGSEASPNFITTVAYMLMLSISVLATPFLVKSFLGSGLSALSGMAMAGAAAMASGGVLTPAGFKSAVTGVPKKSLNTAKLGIKRTAVGFNSQMKKRSTQNSSGSRTNKSQSPSSKPQTPNSKKIATEPQTKYWKD